MSRSPCGSVDRNTRISGMFPTKNQVAPLAGAWIEIMITESDSNGNVVAPLAGAWIEMEKPKERGKMKTVAPLAGAWIEIP